jgi:thiamine-monophosphate kinase
MNEFELIEKLTATLGAGEGVVTGPGDDCAVLDLGVPGEWALFKTDAVVEGVHFNRETEATKVGHKALARCLSDVAAMGGKPKHALVTLGLPAGFDPGYLAGVYEGLNGTATEFGVTIVGGETTANGDRLLISISLIGSVPAERAVLRSGAQIGDAIFVSGELGGSIAGRHLDFVPRLRESTWLAGTFGLHAMIDLSDGLAGDLRHLARASGVAAELLEGAVPITREAKQRARSGDSKKPPLLAALTDGEDFELLFTLASRDAVAVLDGWKREFPDVRLSCIGKIIEGSGVRLRDVRGVRELNLQGFTHFARN